jgi:hypothetical protein
MDQRTNIAQLNIEHYRRKLATEQDEAKRSGNRLFACVPRKRPGWQRWMIRR